MSRSRFSLPHPSHRLEARRRGGHQICRCGGEEPVLEGPERNGHSRSAQGGIPKPMPPLPVVYGVMGLPSGRKPSCRKRPARPAPPFAPATASGIQDSGARYAERYVRMERQTDNAQDRRSDRSFQQPDSDRTAGSSGCCAQWTRRGPCPVPASTGRAVEACDLRGSGREYDKRDQSSQAGRHFTGRIDGRRL